jgi:uncharacterized membrane protein YphA (DoxX/SURF4 family)
LLINTFNMKDIVMENASAKGRNTGYWIVTVLAALLFAVPGTALLLRVPHFTQDMAHLGYPAYFLTILGIWKILGAAAIVAPRLPRLKEWAYAGMIFDATSAAISRAAIGDGAIKVIAPLIVAGLAIASWALRPQERMLSFPHVA